MEIREIRYEEYESASALLWKSFYETARHTASMSELEKFRDLVDPVSLSVNVFAGSFTLFGAFSGEELLGVAACTSGKITMLYVAPDKKRKGIGSNLLRFMEEKLTETTITLRSTDEAVLFYEKHGYSPSGSRRMEQGVFVTPMKKERILS